MPNESDTTSAMDESATTDALLETAARPFLSYSFLFKAWAVIPASGTAFGGHIVHVVSLSA